MSKIDLYDGEWINSALKRFRKACEDENILKDFRRHESYEKPSEKIRRKRSQYRKQVNT